MPFHLAFFEAPRGGSWSDFGFGSASLIFALRHYGQPDRAQVVRRPQDGDRCFAVVGCLRLEYVGDVGLRVTVIQRKEGRLDLHHDSMARKEHVIHVRQFEAIRLWLVGGYRRRMLETLAVAAAEHAQYD